jgi:hypothetical protein
MLFRIAAAYFAAVELFVLAIIEAIVAKYFQ